MIVTSRYASFERRLRSQFGMVFFNWATMQMAAKIVYYGPGLCGKTSNLSYIYAKTSPGSRGEMVSLETESDRTLFFVSWPWPGARGWEAGCG